MTLSKDQAKKELWKRGVLSWKLHKGQSHIYKTIKSLPTETREALIFCSRRWGKSYLGIIMAMEICLSQSNIEVAIIAPSLKQTKSIITPIINKIAEDAPEGLIKQTKSELIWKVGKSTLVIAAFDTAVEACRGREFAAIFLEESALAPIEEYDYIINSVLRPTLMHTRGRIHHLTTPPKQLNHPIYTTTLPSCAIKNAFFKFTIEDNPLLTPEVIEQEIEAMGGRDNPNCQRELFCEMIKDDSTLVIPEFDINRHVKPLKLPEYYFALTSIDFGGSLDKHGIVLCYYDFQRAKFCIYREALLDKNTPTIDIKKASLELESQIKWHKSQPNRLGDAPGQIRIDLAREDFSCRMPTKEKGSVEANINAIRLAFQRDQIEIDPSCTKTIATFQYGSWLTNKQDWQRTPELGHLDLLAATLYAYKHINKSNPYPSHYQMQPDTHYYEPKQEQSTEALLQLFA